MHRTPAKKRSRKLIAELLEDRRLLDAKVEELEGAERNDLGTTAQIICFTLPEDECFDPNDTIIIRGQIEERDKRDADVDIYGLVDLDAGDTLIAYINSVEADFPDDPHGNLQSKLVLFGQLGTLLDSSLNASANPQSSPKTGRDPYLEHEISDDGTYYLGVSYAGTVDILADNGIYELNEINFERVSPGGGEDLSELFGSYDLNLFIRREVLSDFPRIDGTSAGQEVNDNETINPFSDVTISDEPIPGQEVTVTITLDDASKGRLTNLISYSQVNAGEYRFVGSSADATTAIRGLLFEPAQNRVPPGMTELTTFTIVASNGITQPVTDTITTVITTSVSDPPILYDQQFQIDENSADGATVGQLVALDPDIEDARTYSIIGDNLEEAFVIDASAGEISVANSSALDFETASTLELTLQVADSIGLIDTAIVTITLIDINEAPTIDDQSFLIGQNSANGASVGIVGVSDPDLGDRSTFSITGGNVDNAFAIDEATGQITLANRNAIDVDSTRTFNLQIRVEDSGQLTDSATISISVEQVPLPVANGDRYTVDEDTTLTVAASGVLGNDESVNGGPLDAVSVKEAHHGQFELNRDGSFTYVPDGNFSGTDTFTYQTREGDLDSTETTVTISVVPVNDPPTLASTPGISIPEGGSGRINLDDLFSDVETLPQDATFEVHSTDNGVLVDIDPASHLLTIEGDGDFNGKAELTIRALDDGDGAAPPLSVDQTILVTVDPVNDAPRLAELPDLILHRGDFDSPTGPSLHLDDFFEDVETDASDATFETIAISHGLSVTIDPASHVLLVQPDAFFSGEGEIAIRVADTGDGDTPPITEAATILVTVAPVLRELEPNDTIDAVNKISLNTDVGGSVGSEFDRDLFAVRLDVSGRLIASAEAVAGNEVDPKLTIFGSDRQLIVSSDDVDSGNASARIGHHVSPGIYYLEVDASEGSTTPGAYRISTSFVPATPPFVQPVVGEIPSSIATGQFNDDNADGIVNHDDYQDLVVANRGSHSVSVLLGLGDGTYRPEVSYTVELRPTALVVEDLNNDGQQDLAIAHGLDPNAPHVASDRISVLLGRGDGSFSTADTFEAGIDQRALTVGDFDGDGIHDLAVATATTNQVVILKGSGDGSFQRTHDVAAGGHPEDLAAADFNGDGQLDLAVVNRRHGQPERLSEQPGTVSVLLGTGDGDFYVGSEKQVGLQPTSIGVGDLNGDNLLDLAVANFQSDDVSLLFGMTGGTFQSEKRIDVRGAARLQASTDVNRLTSRLAVSDFNIDGILDLAVTSSMNDRVTVALGSGDGEFRPSQRFSFAGPPEAMAVGDFDGDHRPDLAAVHFDNVSIRIGRGDGTFQSPLRNVTPKEPQGLVAGDFNNDGRADLAAVIQGTDQVSVLLGLGDGTYDESSQYSAQKKGDTDVSNRLWPLAITSADFNADGRLDLATANLIGNNVSVLLGLGDGTYQAADSFVVEAGPGAITAADFNGDGLWDLATANQFSDDVSILIGLHDGRFRTQPALPVGHGGDGKRPTPSGITAADFNDDGLMDLAVTNSGTEDIAIFLGRGDGTFSNETRFGSLTGLNGFVVGDFNGDGMVDLAITLNSGRVHILTGAGNGSFTMDTEKSIHVGDNPVAIVNDDFNGDGVLDLATANSHSNDVTVLLGDNDGNFGPPVSFAVGRTPSGLVVLDANDDGRLDLATSNVSSDDVTILLGDGRGGFVTPDRFASNTFGAAPLFDDFNGDGTHDSVVLNLSGQILLRLGRPAEPGRFDALQVVNLERPARAFTVLARDGGRLLAAIDRASDSVTLYAVASDGLASVAGQFDAGLQPVRIAAADVNGDGRKDLVVANAGSDDISIFLASEDGGFELDSSIPVAADPSALELRDVSGDEAVDILVTDQASGTVNILLNRGSGSFGPAKRFPAGTGLAGYGQPAGDDDELAPLARWNRDETVGLAVGDFSKDGNLDVAAVHRGSNSLSILLGKGTGSFVNPRSILTGSRPSVIRTGQLNDDSNDGKIDADDHLDLAVLNEGSDLIGVYLGDGRGGFSPPARFAAGNAPTGISIHDVDGDGSPDLAVGNEFGDVMTLLGRGDGTFDPFTRLDRDVAVAVGDFDGDGIDDWIVANEAMDRMAIEFGKQAAAGGKRQVQPVQPRAALGGASAVWAPADVETVDLDKDGYRDVVMANRGGNNVLVYMGTGSKENALATPRSFFAGTNPVDVTVQDVDGDGRVDVVVTNEGSNDVSVLLGVDDERLLRPGVRLDVGLGPVSSQVQDVNEDGMMDLVVTNAGSNNVYLLHGLGDGFFDDTVPDIFATGRSPQQTFVGQFDGRPGVDLVTLNRQSDTVTYFPSFNASAPVNIRTGGIAPVAGLATDLSGDGILDLIIGNSADGAISLLLGGEKGLTLGSSFFAEGLQHPTAMALANLGEGQELTLLVAIEGDDLVSIFNLQDVLSSLQSPGPLTTDVSSTSLAMTDFSDQGDSSTKQLETPTADVERLSTFFKTDFVDEGSGGQRLQEWTLLKSGTLAIGKGLTHLAMVQFNSSAGTRFTEGELVTAVVELVHGTSSQWVDALSNLVAHVASFDFEMPATAVDHALQTGAAKPAPDVDVVNATRTATEQLGMDAALEASAMQPSSVATVEVVFANAVTPLGSAAAFMTSQQPAVGQTPVLPRRNREAQNETPIANDAQTETGIASAWHFAAGACAIAVVGCGVYAIIHPKPSKGLFRHARTD